MNDAFIENLYGDMTSLYHLDQIRRAAEKTDGTSETPPARNPLPAESVALLCAIAGIWVLIGISRVCMARKAKKK